MALLELTTDANGFALFDPQTLARTLGRQPEKSDNLLTDFKTLPVGDAVLDEGAVVPIYPITDGTYLVSVRLFHEARPAFALDVPYASSGVYPLHVTSRVVLGDLAVLQEWWPEEGWHGLDVAPGFYAVEVTAYLGYEIPGFDLVLSSVPSRPSRTATWQVDLDVGHPKKS